MTAAGVFEGVVGQHEQKFLAADARANIAAPRTLSQQFGELLQYRVAGVMAEAIVDTFKIVEVGEDHPKRKMMAGGGAQLMAGPFFHGAAIGQAGERIGQR